MLGRKKRYQSFCEVLFFVSAISLILWAGYRLVIAVDFDISYKQNIKKAVKATTVEEARGYLKVAVVYLEKRNITKGHTSIFLQSKDENVGLWYIGVKKSLNSLNKVTTDTTEVGEEKILLQLRKKLTRPSFLGNQVVFPAGISVYPSNTLIFYWGMISLVVCIICILSAYRRIGITDHDISGSIA